MDVYINRAHNIKSNPANELDGELFETIYRTHYKNVYNYIGFRINNHFDSEELAASVFENAIRKFNTYKPNVSTMEAWLIGIAKNVVTDYLRSKKHKFFTPLDDIIGLVSQNKQPEEVMVINEDNRALIKAMAMLKNRERQVLSMKFATDLRNNEIAKILNISDSNVGVIIHRAIGKLKEILDKEGEL